MALFKDNIALDQGATFRRGYVWKSTDENGANPVPNDLTGYAARMQIRPSKDSSTVFHTLTTENGGITLGGAAGTVDLMIPDDVTALFRSTRAVYDLELVSATGDVMRLVEGGIKISPEVTR